MSSLQEQLLKAGLTSKDKLTKVKGAQRKQKKVNRKHKLNNESQSKVEAQKVLLEQAERAKALNQEKNRQAEEKAINAQIIQLIESNQQDYGKPQVTFNFSDNNKIKKIEVSHEVYKYLINGLLAITQPLVRQQKNTYPIIPKVIAEKIYQRSPDFILLLNSKEQVSKEGIELPTEDDPYSGYEIPDDLMW